MQGYAKNRIYQVLVTQPRCVAPDKERLNHGQVPSCPSFYILNGQTLVFAALALVFHARRLRRPRRQQRVARSQQYWIRLWILRRPLFAQYERLIEELSKTIFCESHLPSPWSFLPVAAPSSRERNPFDGSAWIQGYDWLLFSDTWLLVTAACHMNLE